MKIPAVVFLGDSLKKGLGAHEQFDMEARQRELQKAVDALRAMVPSATFTLFASSLSAGMTANEEDVRTLEQHFTNNPDVGSIIRDQPDMLRPAR